MTQVAPFVCGDAGGTLRDLGYLLWEVRLTVLLQLLHWKLRASDVWTVTPSPSASEQAARILARVTHHGRHQSSFQT